MQFSQATDRFVVYRILHVNIPHLLSLSYVRQVLSGINVAQRLDILAQDEQMVQISNYGASTKQ